MAIVDDRVEQELVIEAQPQELFEFFTDPEKHARWMGRQAILDPRPGGTYRCLVHDTATVAGEYVEVEPPRRVVFTWGFEGNAALPPGLSTVTVTLTPHEGGTLLRLVHTGLPHPSLADHDRGCQGYLAQLTDVAAPSRKGQPDLGST